MGQRYVCPDCGEGGGGDVGSAYKCHRCNYDVIMKPANNNTIFDPLEKEKKFKSNFHVVIEKMRELKSPMNGHLLDMDDCLYILFEKMKACEKEQG